MERSKVSVLSPLNSLQAQTKHGECWNHNKVRSLKSMMDSETSQDYCLLRTRSTPKQEKRKRVAEGGAMISLVIWLSRTLHRNGYGLGFIINSKAFMQVTRIFFFMSTLSNYQITKYQSSLFSYDKQVSSVSHPFCHISDKLKKIKFSSE